MQRCLCLLVLAAAAAAEPSHPPARGQAQLSRQTDEWWRWVLVRLYDSSTFIPDGDDAARQAFVDDWCVS